MAVLFAPQAQRQDDLLALISLFPIENPGGAGGDRAQFPEDPSGGGEIRPSHFVMMKSAINRNMLSWQLVRPSIVCPGLTLPNSSQRMPVWADSTGTVVEEQPGKATLTELDGQYTVTDGDGNEVFTGGEVGVELAFWRTTFGVPVDSEVLL